MIKEEAIGQSITADEENFLKNLILVCCFKNKFEAILLELGH